MDCREFQEQVTPAVDRLLPEDQMRAFLGHANVCPACRSDFEVESITKSVVRSRLKMVRTPPHVVASIAARLREEQASPAGAARVWWQRLRTSVYFRPAIAFAVGSIAVVLLVRGPAEEPGRGPSTFPPGNVIEQARYNYSAVVNKTLLPAFTGNEPQTLLDFFTGKTEFPVLIPRLKDCELVGGVQNEFAGVKLAHVVYRHGAEVVYVYQACWEEVQKGDRLNLPVEVRDQLRATGWYSAPLPDGNAIVLWTKGRTLCSAVAHMPKEELLACMTEGEQPTTSPW